MRKITLLILFVSLAFLSCASQRTSTQKKSEANQLVNQISDSVDARALSLSFNYVYPMRFPPHILTSDYNVTVKGDSLSCFLPYFGRAYRTDLSNINRSPLDFTSLIKDWTVSKGIKQTDIHFKTRNKLEQLDFYLTLYPNGSVNLRISSSDRESISFDGDANINISDNEK